MATINAKNPLAVSGRIGPVVTYQTKEGKQIVRDYVKPTDPHTPKQLAQRARFALVNKSLAPLRPFVKRCHGGDNAAYMRLVGKANREAIEGDYSDFRLNFDKIGIAEGNLPLPSGLVLRFDAGNRTAVFEWNPTLEGKEDATSGADKMNVVCLHSVRPAETHLVVPAIRARGSATLTLPERWNPGNIHFWVYFTSPDLRHISNSVHFAPF